MRRTNTYNTNVFVNCPFDKDYLPILHAITFAIRCAKFTPRSSLEIVNTGETRLHKIVRIMQDCRFAIHDVSRTDLSSVYKHDGTPSTVPRFNMPFECGLFFGATHFEKSKRAKRETLILEKEKYRLPQSMSDLGGNDPDIHGDDPMQAVACVRHFLNNKNGTRLHGPTYFIEHFKKFDDDLTSGAFPVPKISVHELKQLPCWADYSLVVDEWLDSNPLP